MVGEAEVGDAVGRWVGELPAAAHSGAWCVTHGGTAEEEEGFQICLVRLRRGGIRNFNLQRAERGGRDGGGGGGRSDGERKV